MWPGHYWGTSGAFSRHIQLFFPVLHTTSRQAEEISLRKQLELRLAWDQLHSSGHGQWEHVSAQCIQKILLILPRTAVTGSKKINQNQTNLHGIYLYEFLFVCVFCGSCLFVCFLVVVVNLSHCNSLSRTYLQLLLRLYVKCFLPETFFYRFCCCFFLIILLLD